MIDSKPVSLTTMVNRGYQQTDGASLAVFRIVFGFALVVYAVKAIAIGEVRGIYVDPAFHFSYWGFYWLQPWAGHGMFIHFAGIAFFALLVAVGLAYRFASVCLALLYTFVFFCESTGYLNHYYLVTLLCWMMVILPADRVWSLDRFNRPMPDTVPRWAISVARWHIGVPYFFGGIAKLNSDWLSGQPMRMTLSSSDWFLWATTFVPGEAIVYLFSWGGAFFDLLIVPALLLSRTRPYAFCASLVFHLTNAFVFPIGIFPWLMIGATTIFFAPSWPRRLLAMNRVMPDGVMPDGVIPDGVVPESDAAKGLSLVSRKQKWFIYGLMAYGVFHCLFPLRHLVTEGNPSWTERGHYFSWHMMLRGKRSALRMYVTNPQTGLTYKADLRKYLTVYQHSKVARDPEHIRQLAGHIADNEASGDSVLEVRAFSLVSLNGRQPQLLVDPSVDLVSESRGWSFPEWIVPLQHPVLKNHWDVPLLQWETVLDIHGDRLIEKVVQQSGNHMSSTSEVSAATQRSAETSL